MGLVKALRSHSNRATSFDELIELKEEAKITAPLRDIKGVRTIVYKTLTDIGPLLDGTYHAHTLNPEAEPFVPRLLAQGQAAGNEEEEADGGSGGDEGIDHTIDIETAALSIDAGRLEEPSVPVTEEELAAAEVFLVAYRRLLSRREAASLPDARTRWYTRCLEITQKFKMRLKYRVMFLGPLPHALVCLEKANTDVYSMKKKANRRLKVTEHEQLEEATEQFNHAS